jgi:acyl-CoA thioesterase
MADFLLDTELTPLGLTDGVDGSFTRDLSRDWEIWGPNGGYLGALMLRAAGATCGRNRPANATVHFLGVASMEQPVSIVTEVQRKSKVASSVIASIHQSDRLIARAMVWAIDDDVPGFRHDFGDPPDAPDWRSLPTVQERCAADGVPYTSNYRFWDNFEQRPISWISDWANRPPLPPEYLCWLKMLPRSSFADPWVDAGRLLLAVDLGAWPAASRAHPTDDLVAPSIDVSCEFHRLGLDDWLLLHGVSPHAGAGLIASHQQVWNDRGELLASGVSHLLCRPVR